MYAEVIKGKNGDGGQVSIYDLVRRVTATAAQRAEEMEPAKHKSWQAAGKAVWRQGPGR